MSLLLSSLSVELVLDIASFADTRSLSALARTCRILHNLVNPMLEKAFTAELEGIAIWAIRADNLLIFSRVMTAALTLSALDPRPPSTQAFLVDYAMIFCAEPTLSTTRQDDIYMYVKQELHTLLQKPAHPDRVKILKLALSHGVSPVTLVWWRMGTTAVTRWLSYGVRHGDLDLVRWLLVEARGEVGGEAMVGSGQTMLNFALYRRFDRPRNEHVEEIFQLLGEHYCRKPRLRHIYARAPPQDESRWGGGGELGGFGESREDGESGRTENHVCLGNQGSSEEMFEVAEDPVRC
ncbi:hypothetical protein DFP73DRAFT_554378 [Morchella snyderi]|nr:hypothetical protein DFP73DRAFT_554378 [Morchella snyderi]